MQGVVWPLDADQRSLQQAKTRSRSNSGSGLSGGVSQMGENEA